MKLDTVVDGNRGWMESGHWQSQKGVSRRFGSYRGHSNIRTAEIYLRMDPSEKLEAVEAVIPPELHRGRFKAPDA